MKEKYKTSEEWEEKKKLIMRPLAWCAALLLVGLGGGTLAYNYYMKASQEI